LLTPTDRRDCPGLAADDAGQLADAAIQNGISRHFERQADAASLELARKPTRSSRPRNGWRWTIPQRGPVAFNAWMLPPPAGGERIEMAER